MVNVGLIGAGGIAAEHLKQFSQSKHAKLVSVCDIVKENAERAATQYGIHAYTNFDEMLEQEKLDALVVCVPPFAHGDIEEKAAQRGIHLLVEKPMGIDMEVVRRKAEVLKNSGVIVGTGYCYRYVEGVQKAKQFLQDKQIAMVRGFRFGNLPATPWWRDISKSGGQLVEMTTHVVDLMMYLAGGVKKVSADMALLVMKDAPGISVPDVTSVNFVFDSGAVGHLDTGFVPQPDWRQTVEFLGKDFRVTFEGVSTVTIMEKDQTNTYESTTSSYTLQNEAFLQAILTGDRSLIHGPYEEAMKTLEVTLAANESARTGQSVYIHKD